MNASSQDPCVLRRWPVGWFALCCCLPEKVWFIPVWDYHLQVYRKAWASPLISTMCVFCQRWRMTCPSTLCHPGGGDASSIRDLSLPLLGERERVLGGWRQWWWWWWCVFLIILASRKRGTVTSACCALLSPHKWTNYLWEESSEEGKLSVHMRGQRGGLRSSYTGTHEYHSGQRPCARWRRHVACRHSSPCWVH